MTNPAASASKAIADIVESEWVAANPGCSVTRRNLGTEPLPADAWTNASHDPVDWKYHHIGNYLLNDVLPPNHGQL